MHFCINEQTLSAGQKGDKEPGNGIFLASSCVTDTSPPLCLKNKKTPPKIMEKTPNKQNNEQTNKPPTKQPGSSH